MATFVSRAAGLLSDAIPLPPGGRTIIEHRLSWAWASTFTLLFATALVLQRTAMPALPLGVVFALCVLEIALAVPYRIWFRSGRALGLLLLTGFLVSLGVGVAFFAAVPALPASFHVLFLMVIVPASLCSPRIGAICVLSSCAAHLALVAYAPHPVPSLDVAIPLMCFGVVGFQCLAYGGLLTGATQRAGEESQVSAALLRAGSELARASTTASVAHRLAELTRDLLASDYATVLLRDPDHGRYRVMAVDTAGSDPKS